MNGVLSSSSPRSAGHVPRAQTDVVVDEIKRMIVEGAWAPGARLPIEKELALQFGVSRGPLREGVRALCMMGVLETRQGDGTYVTSLEASLLLSPVSFMVDLQAAHSSVHLQAVRRVLEMEAAGLAACVIDEKALLEADETLDHFESLLSAAEIDHDAVMEADIRFHRIVAHASGNPALEALIEALASKTVRTRMWRAITEDGATRATHAEHRAVLRALAAHDPEAARLWMGAHLLAVEEFIHEREGQGLPEEDAAVPS
ncbi:FadR family transcriptional regulator [Agromyces sp. ISL-38]|uniref:FadR/GntR family transcriptional regulator n=1 Tax=Agromyces sp. ISL-38 TaxID=2819107 RepID=UPI001BE56822|nr:FadR/GntR family transcriptional regulator [Agromyces sp. ISL-38]MBT2500590.1 FadR family transcriptional regulator [Agromyces sp. ISL-38]